MTYRMSKLEKSAFQIQISEMALLRLELSELVEYERKHSFRALESNARFRLYETIVEGAIKMIDLFDEKVELLKTIDEKQDENKKKADILVQKTNQREELELCNANLRKEIADLEVSLQHSLKNNIDRDAMTFKKKLEYKVARDKTGKLVKSVQITKDSSEALRVALTKGFTELEEVMAEGAKEIESVVV